MVTYDLSTLGERERDRKRERESERAREKERERGTFGLSHPSSLARGGQRAMEIHGWIGRR
jgi:hypothetical protein